MAFFNWLLGKSGGMGRRPVARRVAARALVLAAVVGRADLERDLEEGVHDLNQNEQARERLLRWLHVTGLSSELEPDESRFLAIPVAQAGERTIMDAGWRQEGLAVLAWALGKFPLPPYDVETDQKAVGRSVNFFSPDLQHDLRSATLRPASEIDHFASHITIVRWRLRHFRASRDSELYQHARENFPVGRTGVGEPMDFVTYLRAHPRFREEWLDGLRFLDGDLALGSMPIAQASSDQAQGPASIALERQIAAHWLQGEHKTYSKINPGTILS